MFWLFCCYISLTTTISTTFSAGCAVQQGLTNLLEEHQFHLGIGLIVLCQLAIQGLSQLLVARDLCIDRLVIPGSEHEAAEQLRMRLNGSLFT